MFDFGFRGLPVFFSSRQFGFVHQQGQGLVQMGDSKCNLNYVKEVYDDYAILIPAGTWHNLTNTGDVPIKLYSIYAPPEHPFGTVHRTKADAEAAE